MTDVGPTLYWQFNATTVPAPHRFTVLPLDINRSGRAADASLLEETTATKRQFTLYYEVLDYTDVSTILTIEEAAAQFEFRYPDRGVQKSAWCWMPPFPRDLIIESPEEWENVTVAMEEI